MCCFWALSLAKEILPLLEKRFKEEEIFEQYLQDTLLWVKDEDSIESAKRDILQVHEAAKRAQNEEASSLIHGFAQALSCVHTPKHALGLPIYELTVFVHRFGVQHCQEPIEKRIAWYSK